MDLMRWWEPVKRTNQHPNQSNGRFTCLFERMNGREAVE